MASTDSFVSGVQGLTEALRAAINDPADQIRLLTSLASYPAPVTIGTDSISTAIATVSDATAALSRRAALSSLARACAAYEPTSSTAAQAILQSVVPLYDAEILYAADQGDTSTYASLRVLRAAVVTDLETRAATLPELRNLTVRANQPVLAIAYQLYGDATRAAELLAMNPDVIHPLLFPVQFEALSS